MIKVYCYSRCGTCKKALKWLDENNIEHEDIDIKTVHPDKETLKKYYAQSGLPLKRFFNTSGIPYRELGLSKKLPDMSEEEQLALLATDGMLVKRPLVVGDGFVLTGFKVEEWEAKLNSKIDLDHWDLWGSLSPSGDKLPQRSKRPGGQIRGGKGTQ